MPKKYVEHISDSNYSVFYNTHKRKWIARDKKNNVDTEFKNSFLAWEKVEQMREEDHNELTEVTS